MQIHAERIDGIAVVSLCGTLDARAPHELRERVLAAIAEHEPPRVVLDLGELEGVDSAALGLIVGVGRALAERGGSLKLCAPHAGVDAFLRLSRVDRAYETFADRDTALSSF
ncbi:MAG: STAS domain-containing protein [Planctomycetes bacterium]|nr:STAS domain-containing protein [Planctomycetota bacterium]